MFDGNILGVSGVTGSLWVLAGCGGILGVSGVAGTFWALAG